MSDPGMDSCSLVIRAHNEERHIGRLLDGIAQQRIANVEIILVDSGSTDQTLAIARRHPVKILHIQPQEFTFGRSLNLGIAHASHEQVVFASAHVYPVYPDWLEKLLAPLSDPKVGLCYGKQRGDDHTHFSEEQVFASWYPNVSTSRQNNPFCNNANAAIRRRLWEEHPFDETLTGLEDLDWAVWAMNQGHAIAYVAEAEVVHIHKETPKDVYNRYRREAMAYKHIFPAERFSLVDFMRLSSGNILSDLRRAAHQKRVFTHWKSIFWFRLMQFWGTYQGYRRSGLVTAHLRRTFYYPGGMGNDMNSHRPEVDPIRYSE
jgi:rhamnosyltransferase